MNKKTWISAALAISTVMGATLALPSTASAHEVIKEKRVKVIKTTDHHHGDADRRYVERRRVVTRSWDMPSSKRHPNRRYRGEGHKFGHYKHRRHERRYGHRHDDHRDYRRVERRRYEDRRYEDRHDRNSGVRVRINYDFVL